MIDITTSCNENQLNDYFEFYKKYNITKKHEIQLNQLLQKKKRIY